MKFKKCKRCAETKDPKDVNWLRGDDEEEYCFPCQNFMMKIFLGKLGYRPTDVYDFFKEAD